MNVWDLTICEHGHTRYFRTCLTGTVGPASRKKQTSYFAHTSGNLGRGDSSVYQGESVCDMHRGASVFQGEESMCESSYAERVVRVVSGFGESVYEAGDIH